MCYVCDRYGIRTSDPAVAIALLQEKRQFDNDRDFAVREILKLCLLSFEGLEPPEPVVREFQSREIHLFPIDDLLLAELHRRRGDIWGAIDRLCRVPPALISANEVYKGWRTLFVNQCVGMARSYYGKGDIDVALNIETALLRAAPDEIEPVIELMLVNSFLRPDLQACRHLVEIVDNRDFWDQRLCILLANYYFWNGDSERAVEYLNDVNGIVFGDPSYDAWHAKLKMREAAWRVVQRQSQNDPEYVARAASALAQTIAAYLVCISDINGLETELAQIAYYNCLAIPESYDAVAVALESLMIGGDDELWATAAAYFVATKYFGKFDSLLEQAEERPRLWLNPNFGKAAIKFAQMTGRQDLEARICRNASQIVDNANCWRLSRAKVQAFEIRARAQVLGYCPELPDTIRMRSASMATVRSARTRGAPQWFVGIFGQLRHEEEVLPRLRELINAQFFEHGGKGAKVHVGVSTWDETGSRPIIDSNGNHGGANVLFTRLPAEVFHICAQAGIGSVESFRTTFPNTFCFMEAYSRQVSQVTPKMLDRLLGKTARIDIRERAPFLPVRDRLISQSHPAPFSPSADWANQLLMWERIGKFIDMISEIEDEQSVEITGGLFIRADLLIEKADLADKFNSIISESNDRLWVDWDPAAIFFEGCGDRYFLGGRRALLAVGSGWSVIQSLGAMMDGPHSIYRQRFLSHVILGSLLFEQGIRLNHLDRSEVDFSIYRGRFSLDLLAPYLRRDHDLHLGDHLDLAIAQVLKDGAS